MQSNLRLWYRTLFRAHQDINKRLHSSSFTPFILLLTVLGPVQDLDFVSITSNRLTVSWQPHDENPCPTESYAIEYALINSDNCEEISEPVRVQYAVGGATQIPIAGLQPYSTYEVYVFSVNDMGYGPAATLRGQTAEVGMWTFCLKIVMKEIYRDYGPHRALYSI